MKSRSEKDIQNEVLEWLGAIGIFAFHIPNHGKFNPVTNRYNRTDKYHVKGIPDICIFLNSGVTVWIEMKSATGRISAEQMAVGATLKNMGHRVAVCRSRQEVESFLHEMGVL